MTETDARPAGPCPQRGLPVQRTQPRRGRRPAVHSVRISPNTAVVARPRGPGTQDHLQRAAPAPGRERRVGVRFPPSPLCVTDRPTAATDAVSSPLGALWTSPSRSLAGLPTTGRPCASTSSSANSRCVAPSFRPCALIAGSATAPAPAGSAEALTPARSVTASRLCQA